MVACACVSVGVRVIVYHRTGNFHGRKLSRSCDFMYYAIYFANKFSRIGRTFDTSLVKFTKFIFMDGPDHKNFMTAKISSPMVCNTVTRTIMCMCVIHSLGLDILQQKVT